MSDQADPAAAALAGIIGSARRLGVELDEDEARRWLTAMGAAQHGDVTLDTRSGVFGHKVSMLDFDDHELARFRRLGDLVGFGEEPGIETALALSGSAAQSKIQTYPGDADFFERINIHAPTREEACGILARLIREKALATRSGDTYRLMEVRFGSYPEAVTRDGTRRERGASIAWSPAEVIGGEIAVDRGGDQDVLTWEQAAEDPGWCKLDWVVADPPRGELANCSNMLDVTWEAPDGSITPLDGYLDPYFQEVYLEADSIPLFSKLAKHVSPDALDEYVDQLEAEVTKYVGGDPRNYGKAAKRMYNVFRLTGRYPEAAYVRELFDEPTSLLYQVGALIRTMDEATEPGSTISRQDVIAQADNLILDVVRVLEGGGEEEIVRLLLRLRDGLSRQEREQGWDREVDAARAEVISVVNTFFREKLTAVPSIRTYLEALQREPGG